jgi:transposase
MGDTLYNWRECVGLDRDSEKLRRWIIRKKLEGKPVKSICIQARISRKMFYYWWSQYQTQGWKELQEKPKGRPRGPGLEDFLKEKIIKLRKRYERGSNKIAGYLGY